MFLLCAGAASATDVYSAKAKTTTALKKKKVSTVNIKNTKPQTKVVPKPKPLPVASKPKQLVPSQNSKPVLTQAKRSGGEVDPVNQFLDNSWNHLDYTQRFISTHWVDLNYNMDMYFSDEEYKRSQNKSKIVASYEVFAKEGKPLENYFDVSAKVHFPKVSERLSVTIEKERDEIAESKISTAVSYTHLTLPTIYSV